MTNELTVWWDDWGLYMYGYKYLDLHQIFLVWVFVKLLT